LLESTKNYYNTIYNYGFLEPWSFGGSGRRQREEDTNITEEFIHKYLTDKNKN
jgi:hypothetical protein